MESRESVRSEIEGRAREVRYLCPPLAADLRRVVISEEDGFAYELMRLFLFQGVEGTTELMFALEDIGTGGGFAISEVDFDEDRLSEVLGDLYLDSKLYEVAGESRFRINIDSADPDVVDRVAKMVPHHLMNREKDCNVYEWFVKRRD